MQVKFLKDFRGKETNEIYYPAGSVVDVKDSAAEQLIKLGFAEEWKGAETVIFVSPEPVIAPAVEEKPVESAPLTEEPAEEPVKPKRKVKK